MKTDTDFGKVKFIEPKAGGLEDVVDIYIHDVPREIAREIFERLERVRIGNKR